MSDFNAASGGDDSSDVDASDDDVEIVATRPGLTSPASPVSEAVGPLPPSPGSTSRDEVTRDLDAVRLSDSKKAPYEKESPPDVVEYVTRYITFKVRKLPKIDLIAKTNPILAVWDSVARGVVGTTEWVKGHCNADFVEVVAVKHYPGVNQDLHINVFNATSKQIRQKDFLGKAVIQLDLLTSSAGDEVRVALFNDKDPKMDLWLKKRTSCVLIHTKDAALTAGILKSGYVMTREIATDAPVRRASVFAREKVVAPSTWRKRFLVATEGQLAHFDCVKDFFSPEASSSVKIDLYSEVSLEDSVPVGKSLVDHHRDAWQVIVPKSGRSYEFDLVREEPPAASSLQPPPTERKVRSSSDVSFAFGSGNDAHQEADKNDWLRAMAIAMPYKVFGVPLALAVTRSDEEKLIPAPIRVATTWMNEHALAEEGLYRIPGSKSEVDRIMRIWDQGGKVEIPDQYSGGNLASVIVQFLRRLPESIMTNQLAAVFDQVCNELLADSSKKPMLKKLMSKLPPSNYCTLKMLTAHFVKVTQHSEDNHMTLEKLAMCAFSQSTQVLQMLCLHHEYVFDQAVPPATSTNPSSQE